MSQTHRIGRVIRSYREQRHLSQSDLAERAGVGQSWLSRIEGGSRQRIDVADLYRIARVLDVSVEEILVGAGIKPSATPATDYRWAKLERAFRQLDSTQQAQVLAVALTLVGLQEQEGVSISDSDPERLLQQLEEATAEESEALKRFPLDS